MSTMATETAKYTLPRYLEPWRKLIESDLGGNTIENLMNDHKSNAFNNVIRAGLICMCDTKVRMLDALYRRGQLVSDDSKRGTE